MKNETLNAKHYDSESIVYQLKDNKGDTTKKSRKN